MVRLPASPQEELAIKRAAEAAGEEYGRYLLGVALPVATEHLWTWLAIDIGYLGPFNRSLATMRRTERAMAEWAANPMVQAAEFRPTGSQPWAADHYLSPEDSFEVSYQVRCGWSADELRSELDDVLLNDGRVLEVRDIGWTVVLEPGVTARSD